MEIQGKIINVLDAREGVSKSGKSWKMQPYVLETQEQYPRKVYFEVFGEERIAQNTCMFDDVVKVSFDIESREINGRWYTTVRAYKVEVIETESQSQSQAQTVTPSPVVVEQPVEQEAPDSEAQDGDSELPF